ncbi:MAG: glycosyltransferase family 2 protein [Candidatus Methanodesulfokora washburnensis]|jgi:glycosyltransferase involved in cell wall biosynthesis
MSRKPFIIACIPAFNEEKTIARVIIEALKYVDRVIVCDDGSTDLTGEIAKRLGAEVVRHEKNVGYGGALSSLFKKAREINPDVMVVLDADLQHDPNDIPKIIAPVLSGKADIAIGSRFLGKKARIPKYREMGIKIITKLTRLASYKGISDAQSGFRAYSRKAIYSIIPSEQGMGASTEILLKAKEGGLKVTEVPIKISYDVEKPSTQNPIYHGLDVILSIVKQMSIKRPLLFYGVPGTISMLISLFFWVWTLQTFAATRQIITNVTLIAVASMIVGLMLLTTAIILWVLISVVREIR